MSPTEKPWLVVTCPCCGETIRKRVDCVNAWRRADRLRRAIAEHRTAIHNAGPVRVDSRDVPIADAKQWADERLWSALDDEIGAPHS